MNLNAGARSTGAQVDLAQRKQSHRRQTHQRPAELPPQPAKAQAKAGIAPQIVALARHLSQYHPPYAAILSKRDRHKESQSKLEHRPLRRHIDEPKEERQPNKKEGSKSRSKSKGLHKSKSVKQMVKKSKSMARLEPRRERKSESPPFHTKSTTSHGERKQVADQLSSASRITTPKPPAKWPQS